MLLLDIGNTHSRIAEWRNGEITLRETVATCDLNAAQLPHRDAPICAATVVPLVRARLAGLPVHWLEYADAALAGLDLSRVDASTLGMDRMANAIALAHTAALPAAVFDFGTAIDCEVVDRECCFRGGAILPGRMLLRRALFRDTAQLPDLPLDGRCPERAGTNTLETLRFGIDRGAVGAVRELAAALQREFGDELTFIGTGGDAGFFMPELPGWSSDPILTLRGIARVAAVRRMEEA